jgi:hypothetical protein
MDMKRKSNIIVFVVDSARYYSTGGLDDRDKLDMMDRFENESIYFPVTVTTAPSSIMSLTSMVTSIPAYYIARNYNDFRYDDSQFVSLQNILRDRGYEVHSALNSKELRSLFSDSLNHIDRKHWPKGTTADQNNWSNSVMNEILDSFLSSKDYHEPFFMVSWYNVRLDPKTSEHIENGIDILKKHNVYNDTVFILTSDHGYMDPRRGYTTEKLVEMGLSHDLLLTDDNIRIPFYLRYPGFTPAKIETPVSTIDFLPTILSYLNIEYEESETCKMHGLNIMDLINKKEGAEKKFRQRKIRCDARFFAQANRSTAFRDENYKYIVRPDSDIEELYYLPNDEWEENNVAAQKSNTKIIEEFREEYAKSEREIIEFQYKYLLKKLSESLSSIKRKGTRIAILGLGEAYYLDNIALVIRSFLGKQNTIEFIIDKGTEQKLKNKSVFDEVVSYSIEGSGSNERIKKLSKYNYLIVFTDSQNQSKNQIHIDFVVPNVRAKKIIYIDPNMSVAGSNSPSFKTIKMMLKKKKAYYLKDPRLFVTDSIDYLKKIIK